MNLRPERARVLSSLDCAPGSGGPPFRVGVAFDSPRPPRWVAAFVEFLNDLPGIAVDVLPVAGPGSPRMQGPSGLMGALYKRSRRRFDPFGEAEAERGGTAASGPVGLEAAAGLNLGLLIWLATVGETQSDLRRLATHGALAVRLGRGEGAVPFWEEVAAEEPTSTVTIYWHESVLSRGRPVRRAETGTVQGLDFTTNAAEPLVAAMQMLAELCLGFACKARRYEDVLRRVPEEAVEYSVTLRYPTSVEAGRFLARKMMRSAALRLASRGRIGKWFVGVRPNTGRSIAESGDDRIAGFREIGVPRGSLEMADPFLLEHGGRTWLLFEDVKLGGRKGRLACMEVSESGACSEMEVFLERDSHLSYPCVVPVGGELFLIPESAATGRVDLYRFSAFPSRLELVSTLYDRVPLVDTTPCRIGDRWYFFTTTTQPYMETLLFSSSRLDGPWTRHPASPVSRSVRSCRSAGHLFWKGGRLFRPTQDCSVRYGYAITVNEITAVTATEFEEHPVARVMPTWAPGLLGTHMWNETSRLQVIDGFRF